MTLSSPKIIQVWFEPDSIDRRLIAEVCLCLLHSGSFQIPVIVLLQCSKNAHKNDFSSPRLLEVWRIYDGESKEKRGPEGTEVWERVKRARKGQGS